MNLNWNGKKISIFSKQHQESSMSHKVITLFIIGLFIMSLSSTVTNAGEGTKIAEKRVKAPLF